MNATSQSKVRREAETATDGSAVRVVYAKHEDGWEARLHGEELVRARCDQLRGLRSKMRRLHRRQHGRARKFEEVFELPVELVDDVHAHGTRIATSRALKQQLYSQRISLAKRLLAYGFPMSATAKLLSVSAHGLGIILMKEASGKSPAVRMKLVTSADPEDSP
jgi:hypothetical protein